MDLKVDLHEILVEAARDEGIPLAGVVDLDLAFADPQQRIQTHIEKYDRWIQSGHAGAMEYLVRGRDRRVDPKLVFPEAQSIFCVAVPYPRRPAGAARPSEGPRYARYLQGQDYHIELAEKLERVMKAAEKRWKPESPSSPLKWKVCVDTSAVLERAWAALSGLGWIGKNTLLIHPKHGSYLFLGEVLMNQKTGRGPSPLPDYCGNCTRCLSACPTSALMPRQLNSNRCISYWTLEKRGELPITDQDKEAIGPWIAGCDLCQEACPFNLKPVRLEREQEVRNPSSGSQVSNATTLQQWTDLLKESESEYRLRIKNSALNRIKPAQFSRNLAIALRNQLDLMGGSSEDWEVLRHLILARFETETDLSARSEWARCVSILNVFKSPD